MRRRRVFGAVPLANLTAAAAAECEPGFADELIREFEALPGDKALKIYAPAVESGCSVAIESDSHRQLFVASANKTFVLCEALRQVDSSDVVHTIEKKMLALNDTVFRSAARLSTGRI